VKGTAALPGLLPAALGAGRVIGLGQCRFSSCGGGHGLGHGGRCRQSGHARKAGLLSYGDYAINYGLRFWITNPMNNVSICSAVNQAIWQAFQQQGIEIPFPQQVEYQMVGPPQTQQPNLGPH
jgi:small-conductance mechanosensitive channel